MNTFSSQILVHYLYSIFPCLLKIPSLYIMYNCPVQLRTGRPLSAFENWQCKPGDGKGLCISLHTERRWVCEGQSTITDKEHCIKNHRNIFFSTISLWNKDFAVDETCFLLNPWLFCDNQFNREFQQLRTGQKSSSCWKWGRKERNNFVEGTFFIPNLSLCEGLYEWIAWRVGRVVLQNFRVYITEGFLHFPLRWNFYSVPVWKMSHFEISEQFSVLALFLLTQSIWIKVTATAAVEVKVPGLGVLC